MARKQPVIPDDKLLFYTEKLYRLVTNTFKWSNLPAEIPADYLENTLIRSGFAMFFRDPVFGHLVLPCATHGVNVYGSPIMAKAEAPSSINFNSFERTIVYDTNDPAQPGTSCVLMKNLYGMRSLSSVVDFYAKRLDLAQKAFDVNLWEQMTPVMIPVRDKSQQLSVNKMVEDVLSGYPWIVLDELMFSGAKPIQSGLTKPDYRCDKLMDIIHEIENNFRIEVGINASGVEKAERVLQSEADSNNEAIQSMRDSMLSQRKKAAEIINHIFGLSVSVEFNAQEKKTEPEVTTEDQEKTDPEKTESEV